MLGWGDKRGGKGGAWELSKRHPTTLGTVPVSFIHHPSSTILHIQDRMLGTVRATHLTYDSEMIQGINKHTRRGNKERSKKRQNGSKERTEKQKGSEKRGEEGRRGDATRRAGTTRRGRRAIRVKGRWWGKTYTQTHRPTHLPSRSDRQRQTQTQQQHSDTRKHQMCVWGYGRYS